MKYIIRVYSYFIRISYYNYNITLPIYQNNSIILSL